MNSTITFQSTLITASAGSGKTYQLSLRFLALCAIGVDPTRINALTFTKKAAGEFKDRILKQLAEGAQCERAAADLAAKLKMTIHGSSQNGVTLQPALAIGDFQLPEMTQEFFKELLEKLIKNYSQLSLSTFDSFFQKIAKILAPELGLQNLQMISSDQQADIRNQILDEILITHDTDELYTAFQQVVMARESDRIDQTLSEFIKSLHEQYCNTPSPEQWADPQILWGEGTPTGGPLLSDTELSQELNKLQDIWGKLSHHSEEWEEKRVSLIRDLKRCAHTGASFRFPSAYQDPQLLEKLKTGSYIAVWRKKETPSSPALQNSLYKILSSYYNRIILDKTSASKSIYTLLRKYDELYEIRIRQQGLMCFQDITNLLLPHKEQENWISEKKEDITFRLDGWYDHWMLDEFQDTNLTQWRIIKPFLEEIHQYPERSLFIVGDEKQSIYGFRNAERRLVQMLKQVSPWKDFLHPWHMDTSWRSSQHILDFVNQSCSLTDSPLLHPRTRNSWNFSTHSAAKNITGAVKVQTLTGNDDTLCAISDELQRLNPIFHGWSCSILVHTNKEAATVAEWLRSPEGGEHEVYLASDSKIGTDSPLGLAVNSYIAWLSVPQDNFALQHLLHTPLKVILDQDHALAWKRGNQLFGKKGITGILQYIQGMLSNSLSAFHSQRMEQWIIHAEEMDSRACSLQEWVSSFKEMTYSEAQTPQTIRVMTIHKAKGLEDDIIIIPLFNNKAFDALHPGDCWLRKKEERDGTILSQIWSPGKEAIMMSPPLERTLNQWQTDEQLEGLSKLYVALTRAKRQLSIILSKDPEKESTPPKKASFKDILRDTASENKETYGTIDWYLTSQEDKTQATPRYPYSMPSLRASRPLPIKRSPSASEHPSPNDEPTEPSMALNNAACDFGTLVHAVFEKIDWLPASDKLPEWLIQEQSPAAQAVFHCLQDPSVRKEFTKPSEDTKLWREQHLAGIIKGERVSGFLDRAHLSGDTLTIIDFKTTRASKEELAHRYSDQLEDYAVLLKNALGKPSLQIRKIIISTHLNEAVEIG